MIDSINKKRIGRDDCDDEQTADDEDEAPLLAAHVAQFGAVGGGDFFGHIGLVVKR